jgi:hypothetical protein
MSGTQSNIVDGTINGLINNNYSGDTFGLMSNDVPKDDANAFICIIDTTRSGTGVALRQIQIGIASTGSYTIDWGDGSKEINRNIHTYASRGVYTIKIKALALWINFNTTNPLKYLEIIQFGCLTLKTGGTTTFLGCSNLTFKNVKDSFGLLGSSGINSALLGLFESCTSFTSALGLDQLSLTGTSTLVQWFSNNFTFNQNIGNWNVLGISNMGFLFNNATAFNQDIGNWRVSNVTNFSSFMTGKTPDTFSATNLDAIYNGWTQFQLQLSNNISFGTANYTSSGAQGRALLTRANSSIAILSIINNGSGLIRVTVGGHGRTTGEKIFISGVTGTVEANGAWIVTVIDPSQLDLQDSVFTNTYIASGTLRTGYGWTVVDGGVI